MKLENRDFKDKSGKLKENIEGHKEDTSKSDGLSEEHEEDTSKNDGLSEEEKLEEARKAKIENFKMNIPEEDNKLPSVSEEKHPIRKRIKDFLVGIKDKILNRNKKNNNPEEIKDEKPEEIKDEKPEEIKDEKPEETNKPWELPTEVKNKLVEEIAINGLNSETVRNVRESQSKEDGMQK